MMNPMGSVGGILSGRDPVRAIFAVTAAVLLVLAPVLAALDEADRVAIFALAALALGLPHEALDVPVSRALCL